MGKFKSQLKILIEFRITERGEQETQHDNVLAGMNDEFKALPYYGQENNTCLLPSILFSMAFELATQCRQACRISG